MKNPILCKKTGMMKPDLSKISCATFGNIKKNKCDTRPKKKKKSNDEGEKECLCCKNIRAIMRTDLVLLCKGGNVKDHPNAERIHKARWIGFLTKLLEKFQRIPQFGDEESLFAYLSVSTPYASAAKQNAAHDYIFQANGITIKGCHYLPCEMLGHHHTYRRFSDFQSNFLSGLAQGASKYVRLLYSQQKRNSTIWFAMIGISIERKKWPDFTPCTVRGADNQSTTKIAKYLEKEQIQLASHDNTNHAKAIAPYYSNLRGLLLAFRKNHFLIVSHPFLSVGASLEIKDHRASILLTLEGTESFEGLLHFANAGMAVISQYMPMLDVYYATIVDKAGYSGKKNLLEVVAEHYHVKLDKKGMRKPKKQRSHKLVQDLTQGNVGDQAANDRAEVPTDYFLTASAGCPNILEFKGRLSLNNCWEQELGNIAGHVVEENVRVLCESMHSLCIDLCVKLLPEAKRQPRNAYHVQSLLKFTMNYRGVRDEDFCVEASHLDCGLEKAKEMIDRGVHHFIGLIPLQRDGNWTRIHPYLNQMDPQTMLGNVIFTPVGTLMLMPATMVYGGGMRLGPNGNPCIKVHYFLSQKVEGEEPPLISVDDLNKFTVPLANLTPQKKKEEPEQGTTEWHEEPKQGTTEWHEDIHFADHRMVRMMSMERLTKDSRNASKGSEDEEQEKLTSVTINFEEEDEKVGSHGPYHTVKMQHLITLFGS